MTFRRIYISVLRSRMTFRGIYICVLKSRMTFSSHEPIRMF